QEPPHNQTSGKLVQLSERLLVVGDVSCLRDGVNDLPPHYASLVDDERPPGGDAHVVIEHTVGLGHGAVRPEASEHCEIEMFGLGPWAHYVTETPRRREDPAVPPGPLGKLIAYGA